MWNVDNLPPKADVVTCSVGSQGEGGRIIQMGGGVKSRAEGRGTKRGLGKSKISGDRKSGKSQNLSIG